MKGIKIIIAAIASMAIVASCENGNKSYNAPTLAEEEEEEALPFGASDTINGERVSVKCATVNFDFELLQRRIENVKSPDMLMRLKVDYQSTLDSLTMLSENLSAEEKEMLNPIKAEIAESYKKACREYEIPADGVISNLSHCLEQMNSANTREEVARLVDTRSSLLQNLNNIHLCVESNSSRIGEVKRLASQLREEVSRKTRHYNIDF